MSLNERQTSQSRMVPETRLAGQDDLREALLRRVLSFESRGVGDAGNDECGEVYGATVENCRRRVTRCTACRST